MRLEGEGGYRAARNGGVNQTFVSLRAERARGSQFCAPGDRALHGFGDDSDL